MPAWKRILVHHSASKDGVISDFEAIRQQHVVVNGWAEIGYHAVVERIGNSVVSRAGRPTTMQGAHCPGQNQKALGICVVGNFELEIPDAKHLSALVDQVSTWCAIYRIPVSEIKGHRDYRATLCPGRHLYSLLPEIRDQVAARLDE